MGGMGVCDGLKMNVVVEIRLDWIRYLRMILDKIRATL